MMLIGLEILRLCEVLPTLIKSFHHRNILTKYIIEPFYYNYVQCIECNRIKEKEISSVYFWDFS